ncbi:MAG: nicotinate (nicotinamide) nucleotide adenylyltransferase [Anaerolineaceae bacterium]|nr:nicotinate (nicotinamide) nucleotide adenylyltransferase [Anaerolineaceae bacterium]MBN2676491.1 nicotinate (nicotinamide) nucleotide adenylyltransferase [Anaerolineaceae bacterium]
MRIGVFGGTFDPVHVGHLILANESASQLILDKVLWIVTADPPHKDERVSLVEDRLAMVAIAIDDDPLFEISRIEIDRPGPHLAVDTIRLLHELYPRDTLVYLMGGDSLEQLPSWYQPEEFLAVCDEIGVLRRPGHQINMKALEEALQGLIAKVRFIDSPLIDISSTQLKAAIAAGKPFRYSLPPDVYRYILEHNLYR